MYKLSKQYLKKGGQLPLLPPSGYAPGTHVHVLHYMDSYR